MPGDNQISHSPTRKPIEGIVEVAEGLLTGDDPLEIMRGILKGALLAIGINEAREALKPEPIPGLD